MNELNSTREAYGQALKKIANKKNIIVLDADLSKSTKTIEFKKINSNNFFNIGIAEQNLMGIAAGIATTGKIPIVSTFAMFAVGRGFEIIRNSIAYTKLNVKIIVTHAGLTVGEDGGSHQSIEDIALMRSLPNMVVIVPCDANETKSVINSVIKYNGPVYVRLGRIKTPNILKKNYKFKIGKNKVIKKGSNITIIACGIMINEVLDVSKKLKEKDNIEVEIINASNLKPFDEKTLIKSIKKTKCIVTVEEHSIIGGLAGVVSETLNRKQSFIPILNIGINDCFGESGTPIELLNKHGLTKKNIYIKIKKFFLYVKNHKKENINNE